MSGIPAPIQPASHQQVNASLPSKSFRWLAHGLNDWIDLLGKPKQGGIFKYPSDFKWICLVRLIVIVLGLSGAVLGTALVVFKGSFHDIIFQKWPAIVLIGGGLLAVGYTFIASVFRVEISMRDAFFSIVLLSLPWLSLSAGLYILVKTKPMPIMGLVLFLWIWLVPILLTRNLCGAIRIVAPEANKWLVRLSVIASVVFLMVSFVLIWLFVQVPQVPNSQL